MRVKNLSFWLIVYIDMQIIDEGVKLDDNLDMNLFPLAFRIVVVRFYLDIAGLPADDMF